MESTDIEDFTKALADVECRNNQRLFYRLFPAADLNPTLSDISSAGIPQMACLASCYSHQKVLSKQFSPVVRLPRGTTVRRAVSTELR